MKSNVTESTVMAWCLIAAVGLATLANLLFIPPAKQIYEPSQTVVLEVYKVYDAEGRLVYRVERDREIEKKIRGAK